MILHFTKKNSKITVNVLYINYWLSVPFGATYFMFSFNVYIMRVLVVNINFLRAVDLRQLSCTVLLEHARHTIISKKKCKSIQRL